MQDNVACGERLRSAHSLHQDLAHTQDVHTLDRFMTGAMQEVDERVVDGSERWVVAFPTAPRLAHTGTPRWTDSGPRYLMIFAF
jgi:hypothetical protein